jgi:hypothetical protein
VQVASYLSPETTLKEETMFKTTNEFQAAATALRPGAWVAVLPPDVDTTNPHLRGLAVFCEEILLAQVTSNDSEGIMADVHVIDVADVPDCTMEMKLTHGSIAAIWTGIEFPEWKPDLANNGWSVDPFTAV